LLIHVAIALQRQPQAGNIAQHCNQSMALTSEQIYKLGAKSLGWDNSTAAGKALMAEDMKLLKRKSRD